MAHLFLLRFQVEAVMVGRRHLNRHTIGDFETELGELINLIGVIGQKTHGLHAQIAQDLRADEVLAFISLATRKREACLPGRCHDLPDACTELRHGPLR